MLGFQYLRFINNTARHDSVTFTKTSDGKHRRRYRKQINTHSTQKNKSVFSRAINKLIPDQGAPHNGYFRQLNEELKRNGEGQPTLLIDLDRLDENIKAVMRNLTNPESLRIVVKSLPCPTLLRYIAEQTRCNKFMVFHRPFINQMTELMPEAQLLLGKPMPLQALSEFYRRLDNQNSVAGEKKFDPSQQIQWLIDTETRLRQYLKFAKDQNKKLLINIEIDIGLHRGGVKTEEQLTDLLRLIQDNPKYLTFSGFMGYDPHVVKAPKMIKSQKQAFSDAIKTYEKFKQHTKTLFPKLYSTSLTFNGAGSPTYTLHKNSSTLNDISIGSAFLKSTDFDLPSLSDHIPATFIAAPVLKKLTDTEIPFLERFKPMLSRLNINWAQSFFLYGGYWHAKLTSPQGLSQNAIIGHSSNQEIINGSPSTELNIDDYVFLRPTQSEAVLLQFGDINVLRAGKIVGRWPTLSNSETDRPTTGAEITNTKKPQIGPM